MSRRTDRPSPRQASESGLGVESFRLAPVWIGKISPWWVAGVAVSMLTLAAVLTSFTRDIAVTDFQWDRRLVQTILVIPFQLVGAFIVSRLPRNWYGWVWLVLGMAASTLQLGLAYVIFGQANPTSPWVAAAAVATGPAWVVQFWMVSFVLLLFPTGHLPSRRWRAVAAVIGLAGLIATVAGSFVPGPMGTAPIENPWGVGGAAGAALEGVSSVATLMMLAGVVPAAVSLIVRFQSARGVERQQLKWLAAASTVVVAMLALDWFWDATGVVEALKEGIPLALLPVAIGIAILRYRLYDIDRIISRTVSYGVLTAALVGFFLGSVFVLGSVLPFEGEFATAVSTLLVAGLFNPLRLRVQEAVDRRFNRSRYDAVRIVESFSDQLRSEAELVELGDRLQAVATQTMQPQTVSLWLQEENA